MKKPFRRMLALAAFSALLHEIAYFVNINISSQEQEETRSAPDETPLPTAEGNSNPRLVLHIGPPKTGTTSIQCGLIGLNQTLASLDNYYYIGKPCGGEGNNNEMLKLHYVFYYLVEGKPLPDIMMVQLLDRHLKLGHNVIMSSENWYELDDKNGGLEALLKILTLVGFDVTIVVAYRYYHEWLPSLYFQENYNPRFFGKKKNHPVTPTFEKYMDTHSSFLSRVDNYQHHEIMNTTTPTGGGGGSGSGVLTTMMEQVHHHPTVSSVLRYSKHFKNVVIFDMHDAGQNQNHSNGHDVNDNVAVDLVTNFICRALPTAEKTCKLLQLRQEQQRPKNNTGNEMENAGLIMNLRSSTAMETNILSSFAFSRAQQSPTFSIKIGELQEKWGTKNAAKTKEKVFKKITAAVNHFFSDRYFQSSTSSSTRGVGTIQWRGMQQHNSNITATSATTIGNSTMNTTLTAAELIPTDVPMKCPSVEKLDKLLSMSMLSDKFITSRREWQNVYYYPKEHDTEEAAGDHGGVDKRKNHMDDNSGKDGHFLLWLSETRLARDLYIREQFAKSVDNQKFCSIDLEAICSDPFWADFLESLDPIDLWLEKISR